MAIPWDYNRSTIMRYVVEVQDEYRTQSGFRENRSGFGPLSGPTWSVVQAGPIRAGELTLAASMAIAQLGELTQYIDLVELIFIKPALADVLWPSWVVHVNLPGSAEVFKASGHTSFTEGIGNNMPFPTEKFIAEMVESVRTSLQRQLEDHEDNFAKLRDTLAVSSSVT